MGVKACNRIGLTLAFALAALPCTAAAAAAAGLSASSRELAKALLHGECDNAVRLANEDIKSEDAQAIFLVGRMVAEGVCVDEDVAGATSYFSHAASRGFAPAQLEYGLQVGLGKGADQNYEQAGDLCQKGGVASAGGGASLYALGYACTVSGLVSRRMRESLPHGAFVPNTGAALVSFNPASGVLEIRSMPRVTLKDDSTTGSYIRKPLFDVRATLEKAWREAIADVPKPDAARLGDRGIDLTLDLDMTIEGRKNSSATGQRLGTLMPGEVHPVMNAPH